MSNQVATPDNISVGYPVTPEQEAEFFCVLGQAISAWQHVETSLYLVYEAAILPGRPGGLAAAFHEIQTFKMKMNVCDMAVRFCLLPSNSLKVDKNSMKSLTDDWILLRKKVLKKNEKRNELAHSSVFILHGRRSPLDSIKIQSQLFDTRGRAGLKPSHSYGMSEIREITSKFYEFSERLKKFAARIRPIAQAQLPKSL